MNEEFEVFLLLQLLFLMRSRGEVARADVAEHEEPINGLLVLVLLLPVLWMRSVKLVLINPGGGKPKLRFC